VLGYDLNATSTQHFLFSLSAVCLAGIFLLSRALVNSRLGKILVAIRDGENRVRFTGYDPAAYKTFIYAVSGSFAGLAGMLFVLQMRLITPTEMDISHSIKMVLWVALGGRATLVGAVVGAILVNSAENFLSEAWPTGWSYIMGAAFLVTVLFLPKGLVGWFQSLSKERLREKLDSFTSSRAARRIATEGARDAA
jgi:urea transport system permease protein